MTSTVLDVTVFLLCLSAGVGVLTNAGAVDGNVAASPDAENVADVVSASTATVEYRTTPVEYRTTPDEYRTTPHEDTASGTDTSGEDATATHHATLAELIARAAVLEADGSREDATNYPSEVRERVREILRDLRGGRIRLTASPSIDGDDSAPFVVGAESPSNGDVDVAVVTAPAVRGNSGITESSGSVRIVVEVW